MIEPESSHALTSHPRGSAAPSGLLRASLLLAVCLVATKACSADFAWWPKPGAGLLMLIAASWSDVLFALACGLIGELVWLVTRRSRLAGVVRVTVLLVYAFFAMYAVAAIGLFRYFNRPLTYDLLGMVGNGAAIRSSLFARITLLIGIGLVVVPLLFLALSRRRSRNQRAVQVALRLASIWVAGGFLLHRTGWEKEALGYLWLSPHGEFVRTAAINLTGRQRPSFTQDFPREDMDEFRTFGARPGTSRSHFVIPEGVARPNNVIVIVLESVGTKYLGLYGSPTEVTPTLTKEAAQAIVFDNIYAHASFTYASFRPLNFSVYPGLPWHYSLLEDARPLPQTLAATLKARGARTAYLTSGDLDWGDQRWLLGRQNSFDLLQGAADLGCPLLSSWGSEDRCAIDRLIQWIGEEPARPFLAVRWTDQTHDPYLPGSGDNQTEPLPDGSQRGHLQRIYPAIFMCSAKRTQNSPASSRSCASAVWLKIPSSS